MYSHTFPVLSERFFKGTTWPRAEAISHLADNDHVFAMLYRELYFRHLYAAGQPSIGQRKESWENYRDLFTVVLNSNLNMQLPNAWLWDMVDEFVYQFQSFLQYRGSLQGKSPEEIAGLQRADKDGVWEAGTVIAFLEELATRSGIRTELSTADGVQALFRSEGYSPTSSNVLRMLGYFSLIGLLRVHCVLGDHTTGLKALDPLNPHVRVHLFATKIPMAAITMAYYCGFAYLALHRHIDAARCFSFGCVYISRVKSQAQRGPGYDQILKKNEQMYALLAVTLALCPPAGSRLDEAVATSLREKYGEKTRAMASGSADAFEELFSYGCPKFAMASPPNWSDGNANTNALAYKAQLTAFMGLVEERRHLPALKQFLRLYTTIPVSKLASLAELDESNILKQLELLKSSSVVITWPGKGGALAGEPQACGDIDFSIESQNGEEMVVVKETKAKTTRGDFLVRHIQKFENIVEDLKALETTKPSSVQSGGSSSQQPKAVSAH